MATTSLQSLHLPRLPRRHHRHRGRIPSTATSPSSSSVTLNLSSSSTSTTSSHILAPSTTLDALAAHLSSADFRQADNETRRLLVALAGDAAQKRGYVFFSEVQFISADDLRAIDELWIRHSDGRFGYSVQRRVWVKARRDFTRFFINVGWMRRLDTEVEQFIYRSFPTEFIWELGDSTPEGHLPLTNALRGTQLLGSILRHPAFEVEEEVGEDKGDNEIIRSKILSSKKLFKTDYSF